MQNVEFSVKGNREMEWLSEIKDGMLDSERCLSTFVTLVRMLQQRGRDSAVAKNDWVRAGMGEVRKCIWSVAELEWDPITAKMSVFSEDSLGILEPTQREAEKVGSFGPHSYFNQSNICFAYFIFWPYASTFI